MKNGSVGKVSENRFARADLEHIHLMIDDDMRNGSVENRPTMSSPSLTAQEQDGFGKEWANRAIRAGCMRVCWRFSIWRSAILVRSKRRILSPSAHPDNEGKAAARKDDPDIAEKMCRELEGIFLWAFEGLQRLVRNQFRFSRRANVPKANRDVVKQDAKQRHPLYGINSICRIESEQIHQLKGTVRHLHDHGVKKMPFRRLISRTVSDFLVGSAKKYGIEHSNNMVNAARSARFGASKESALYCI